MGRISEAIDGHDMDPELLLDGLNSGDCPCCDGDGEMDVGWHPASGHRIQSCYPCDGSGEFPWTAADVHEYLAERGDV